MSASTPSFLRDVALSAALLAALLLAAPVHAIQPGDRAPAVSGRALDGASPISLDRYRGKVVYLDFWASWCAPCAKALPALDALRSEFPAEDFAVLAINVDSDLAAARAFLARRPVGYPSVMDPKGDLPGAFDVKTMPTSFLIDRTGVIRHVHRGFRDSDIPDLRSRIQQLVASGR